MSIFTDNIFTQDPLASVMEEKTVQLKEGERRTVAILFADIKGFTEMSEKLDPEIVQTTIDKIMRVFTQSIENYGGYVDKYSGDEIMALFGAKVASEVDTERAIRAGLQMLDNLKGYNDYLKKDKRYGSTIKPLAIRIGINIGLVTTGKIGKGREGDFTVYGDAVNLASRLESNAPVNSIMVPEIIEKMLLDQFEYSDLGSIVVKGKKKPISVFTVNGIKKTSSPFQNQYKTVFFGRGKELKYLQSLYKNVARKIDQGGGGISMVGIKAEAGVGKTRLIYEFLNQILPKGLSPNYAIIGKASNLTRKPYSIFISILRYYFQLSEVDGLDTIKKKVKHKYGELTQALTTQEQKQLDNTEPIIGFLLGIPSEDIRLKTSQKELQTHIHLSLCHFIQIITLHCNQASIPMVLVLEDLHWIDDLSIEVLHYLIREFTELDTEPKLTGLFVFNYRQSFEFPTEIKVKKNFNELDLSPLSPNHSKEMIFHAFHSDILPEYELKNIMKISAGIPFYIEEWIAYINTKQKDTGLTVEEIIKKYPVPTTLNALILSRIDALDENSKGVLQSAAVIGVHFYDSILQLLHEKLNTGTNIADALKELIDKDFIHKGAAGQYNFKHILARDVVYDALLKANRKMLHREVGYLFEETFTENREQFYYELAEHFDKAEEYEKAVIYLEEAGSKARELSDNKNAADFYFKLVHILENSEYPANILDIKKHRWKPNNTSESENLSNYLSFHLILGDLFAITGQWDASEQLYKTIKPAFCSSKDIMQYAAYCNSLGYVYFLKGNFSDSRTWLCKGVDACKENPNHDNYKAQLTYCLTNLSNLAIDEGHLEEAENILLEIQENISDAPSPKDIVYLYWSLGSLCRRQGKITKAFTHFKKVHELCTANKFSNQASKALGMMAVIYNIQGEFNKAAKIFHKLIDLLEQRGDRRAIGDTYGNLAITHLELHDYKNAMKYFKTQLSICTKMNDKHNMCRVNSNIGYTYLEIGNYDKAIIHCNGSIKLSDEVGIPELRAQATDNIGNVYIQIGDFKNAEKYLQETLNIFTELGNERGIATAKSGLGIIKLEENSLIEAVTFFTDALDVFKKINELTKLARFYLKRGIANQGLKDYDNAENDLNQAERIAIKLDDAGLIFQARLYSVLNDYYKEIRSISETEKALKDLDNKTLRNADKAFLYYQLWLLKGNSNYKKKACISYKKLFSVKQSYFFKKYLDLLQ